MIAAPYLDTAVAFGATWEMDEEWLRRLMRFAPAAGYRGLAEERKIDRPWKRRADRGFAEYGALLLEAAAPKRVSKTARRRMRVVEHHRLQPEELLAGGARTSVSWECRSEDDL